MVIVSNSCICASQSKDFVKDHKNWTFSARFPVHFPSTSQICLKFIKEKRKYSLIWLNVRINAANWLLTKSFSKCIRFSLGVVPVLKPRARVKLNIMQIKHVFFHGSCKSCLVLIEFLGFLDYQTSMVGYVNVNAVLGNRRNQAITSQVIFLFNCELVNYISWFLSMHFEQLDDAVRRPRAIVVRPKDSGIGLLNKFGNLLLWIWTSATDQ